MKCPLGGDKLYAFNAKTGETLWSTNVGGSLDSTAFADGDLYIASEPASSSIW